MNSIVRFVEAQKVEQVLEASEICSNGTFIFCDENERFYIKMKDKLIGITPKKREVLKLKCKLCGAPLPEKSIHGSIVQCEYCHSTYDIDNWSMDVE